MREAGRVVANALAAVQEAASVGVSLRELDEAARTGPATAGWLSGMVQPRGLLRRRG
jgi:methionyl aminopeptidase